MPKSFLFALLFFFAGWLATTAMLPGITAMISKANYLKANYKGELIPCGLGVVLYLSVIAIFSVSLPVLPKEMYFEIVVFLFTFSAYTLLGLMDDFWGSGDCRGLSGHLRYLLRGEVTTGLLKASVGGAMAVIIAATLGKWTLIPLNALIIALSVNLINLLDLRPGRAGKSYLLLTFLLVAAFPDREEIFFTMVVAGSVVAYLPIDLKAKAMMGDAGANALGSALGISAVWFLSLEMKGLYLVLLGLLHLLTEKYSLTGIISNNKVLDYIDRLGRK